MPRRLVLPANAGVIPRSRRPAPPGQGAPRERGGDPVPTYVLRSVDPCSPANVATVLGQVIAFITIG